MTKSGKKLNKNLKVLTDKALCELVSRKLGKKVTYKKPLTNKEVTKMKSILGVENG